MDKPPVVAIVNTNPDLVRLMRTALERAGFVVFIMHIEEIQRVHEDLNSFFDQHDPRVVVYDVAPPFESNWRFLAHLRSSTGFKGRRFVLTTINKSRLQEIVNLDETVYEVVGQEEELEQLVRAVREAAKARATR